MPTPRPRARVIAVPGKRPMASFYSPKEYKEWQGEVLKALKDVPADFIDGPVFVRVECRVERPKTTKLLIPKPDADNYAKGPLDCITKDGRFWTDDTQVADLFVRKRWSAPGFPAGIYIQIEPVDPDTL